MLISRRSCLLHRFVKGEWRVLSSQTIGVEFASKIIRVGTGSRRKRIKLQVCWRITLLVGTVLSLFLALGYSWNRTIPLRFEIILPWCRWRNTRIRHHISQHLYLTFLLYKRCASARLSKPYTSPRRKQS